MEERIFNTSETLKILRKHYITDELQMVARFIRQGRLVAEKESNKDGWRIREDDLYDFIDRQQPGMVEIIYVYEKYLNELMVDTDPKSFLKTRGKEFLFSEVKKDEPFNKKGISNNQHNQYNSTCEPMTQENKPVEEKAEKKDSLIQSDMDKFVEAFLADPVYVEKLVAALSDRKVSRIIKGPKMQVEKKIRKKINKHDRKTYDEFLTWINDTKSLGSSLIEGCSAIILNRIYEAYYDNGIIKPHLYDKQKKEFVCPVTKKSKNQLAYLLKDTIPLLKDIFSKETSPNYEGDTLKPQKFVNQSNEMTEQICLDEISDEKYELGEEKI